MDLEPAISETVMENGAVIGFLPEYSKKPLLIAGERVNNQITETRRFGYGTCWKLIEDDPPAFGRIVCLKIEEENENRIFTAEDFPAGLVESVVKTSQIEDNRGRYDGSMKVWVLLTGEAAEDREKALDEICRAKKAILLYICKKAES